MAIDLQLLSGGEWRSSFWFLAYSGLGWFAFTVWSISFYPQVILNYQRKSVEGLNFDFVVFNLTKHTSYCIFNVALFFSTVVQREYHVRYGDKELIPVSASDVAFSLHAVALTLFTAWQLFIYPKGNQKVSLVAIGISAIAWIIGACAVILALEGYVSWLSAVTTFTYIQLVMTLIKYIPQAWMNYTRKSTVGWSIGNILLDLTGGIAGLGQMGIQSIDQRSLQNFIGNVGKLGLTGETILFDILFIVQHYCLYPGTEKDKEGGDPSDRYVVGSLTADPENGGPSTVPLLADESKTPSLSEDESYVRPYSKRHSNHQTWEKSD